MRRGMKKTHNLTVRRCVARLIDINEYLASFPGVTLTDKIGVTELNRILLNSIPNIWSRHTYVQGFYCESITFKIAVNMFERMEIAESIYEGVLEPSYKKTTQAYAKRAGHSRQKRGEAASLCTIPEKVEISVNIRKRHVDSLTGKSKTCLIHSPGHSSEECKVLGDFGSKHAKIRPTKYHGSSSVPRKTFNRHQENNTIVNNAVDEILLTKKVIPTNHEAS